MSSVKQEEETPRSSTSTAAATAATGQQQQPFLSARTRFNRLVTALPEERTLWQSLYYFPYLATWDEVGQKQLAVQHVQALLVPKYMEEYVRNEMEHLHRYQPPPSHQQPRGATGKRQPPSQAWSKKHNKKQRPSQHHQKQRRRHHDDDDDGHHDDEQDVDHDDFARVVARSSLQNDTRQRLEAQARIQVQPYLAFLHALPACEPLAAGFLQLPFGGSSSSPACCFCPCSRRLRGWRHSLTSTTTGSDDATAGQLPPSPLLLQVRECDGSAFTPNGLVDHVQTHKDCWWHWIIDEYLRQLFRNYMGLDQPHKVFLPADKYKKAEQSEFLSVRLAMKSLSESEEAYRQQLADSHHREEQLGNECKHLKERLDRERRSETAVRSILAASWESFSTNKVSSEELQQYQTRRDDCFGMLRKALNAANLSYGVRISVPQDNFDLQSIFETNATMFLNDLSEEDATHWVCPIEIQYKAPGKKLKRKLRQALLAIDRGGPTRQFLSDFFRSLDALKAKHANKETALWSRDEKTGFYFPKEDDTILDELGLWRIGGKPSLCNNRNEALDMAKTIVRPYARAVGRLIFYCMANVVEKDDEYQENDQRLYVDTYALPEIYLYYLLAGVKPSSHDYPLGDLAKFLCTHRLPKGNLEGKEDDEFDFRRFLLFVLTVHSHPCTVHIEMAVGRAPVEVIRRMFLSRPSCNVEDVIDCLQPKYTKAEEFPRLMALQERLDSWASQKRLLRITNNGEREGLLPDVLRIICRSDPDVAGTFVLFATGMRCTPYQDDAFRILIEFTFSSKTGAVTEDMLPWTHTCPRDILIPGFAYHGDENLLLEKLSKVLEYANFFNME
eukprot:scaffold4003_cov165-Amphora_coffeaeformis.AAC.19